MLANFIVEYSNLNQLWFIVSPQNPLKKKSSLLSDYHRYELVYRAIEGFSKMKVSNIEFSLPKPSYTIDTLAYLSEKYPEYLFTIIMGADNLESIEKWKNYSKILEFYRILVFPRPGFTGGNLANHPSVSWIKTPMLEISSTFIRNAIAEGKDVRFFMPEKAYTYLQEMNFYK